MAQGDDSDNYLESKINELDLSDNAKRERKNFE
jgi:hypothetical protein